MRTDDRYSTTDLSEIAWLLSNGIPLTGARRVAHNSVEFQFAHADRCEELSMELALGSDPKVRVFESVMDGIRRARLGHVDRGTPSIKDPQDLGP